MNLARELERRLERLVDGISAAVFRGKMHPVDLANRLLRAIDLAVTEGPTGPEIANEFHVGVHPGELDSELDTTALERELAMAVHDLAAQRGWRTGGSVTVTLVPDASVGLGTIRVDGVTSRTPQPPWAQLIARSGRVVLELADNRIVVGRGDDADVVVPDPEVSRRHALILRSDGRSWVADLGSANGTSVNGVPCGADAVPIGPGDQLTLGPASFTFRTL